MSDTSPLVFVQNNFISENVCGWKHRAFSEHKREKSIFIETGTNYGDGIANALALNFEQIFSIEIDPTKYNFAKNRWKNHKHVNILLGDTAENINSILQDISIPAFFWLDAHFNTSEPTYKELVFIKDHKIKTHTILIDDMSQYFSIPHIEKTLKNINLDYTISYKPTWRSPNEILVAEVNN